MSIREDVELYTKLSGEDGSQETIATIGAYLRGYRQGEEDAEPHWIPVAERLPKPRESVIISVNGKYGDWIGEGCYWETTENHVIWKGYRWNATYWDDEIIAWMPLPEPYKEVTE